MEPPKLASANTSFFVSSLKVLYGVLFFLGSRATLEKAAWGLQDWGGSSRSSGPTMEGSWENPNQSNRSSVMGWILPRPQKYVEKLPFRLFLVGLGYYVTYFWGPGRAMCRIDMGFYIGIPCTGPRRALA